MKNVIRLGCLDACELTVSKSYYLHILLVITIRLLFLSTTILECS